MSTINISPQKQPLPFSELEKELSHNRDLFYKPLVNARDIALSSRKKGSQKVNRPLNSFMVYKINFNQVVKLYGYSWGKNMKHATRYASFLWKQATPQEKNIFVEIADQSRVIHKELNPGYNYSHTVKRSSNFVMVDFSKRKNSTNNTNSNQKLKESNPTCPTIDPTTPTTVDDSSYDSMLPAYDNVITYPCGDFNLDCNAYMKGVSNPLENPNDIEELYRYLLLQNKQI
nr:390_t:CDS:2 [Entrophospora candida]